MDNFNYAVVPTAPTAGDAKGANVSYTDDHVKHTQTATINGRVSYLILGQSCYSPTEDPHIPYLSGFAVAPFVSANGTWDEPFKKTSNSSARFGGDFQAVIRSPLFILRENYFYVSPFHQTDFRNLADVNGINAAWEPVSTKLLLGAAPATNPYYRFFWQFRGEAEWVNVSNRGLTNLVRGDHTWIGETLRFNFALFPIRDALHLWPDWLVGRFAIIGTAQNYYDTQTALRSNYYTVALQYKLGPCKPPDPKNPPEQGKVADCSIQGSSSISFEYDWGTNKETLVKANQFLIKLGYAY